MGLDIERDCSGESALSCGREITLVLISSAIFIFSIVCLVKIYRSYRTIKSFEFVTLLFPTVQALIQIFFNIFTKTIRVDLTAFYIQLLSYSILTFGIVEIYLALSFISLKRKNILRGAFFFGIFCISLVYILAIFNIPKFVCQNRFQFSWFFMVGYEFILFIICVYFGVKMIKQIKVMQIEQEPIKEDDIDKELLEIIQESQDDDDEDEQERKFKKQQFFEQRIHQIKLVIILFAITMITCVLWNVFPEEVLDKHVLCLSEEKYTTVQSTNAEIALIVQTILYLIPVIMIPYIFYIIPVKKGEGKQRMKSDIPLNIQRGFRSKYTSFAGSKLHWSFQADEFMNAAKLSLNSKVSKESFGNYGRRQSHDFKFNSNQQKLPNEE